jgi:hypothetical protein
MKFVVDKGRVSAALSITRFEAGELCPNFDRGFRDNKASLLAHVHLVYTKAFTFGRLDVGLASDNRKGGSQLFGKRRPPFLSLSK